MRQVHKHTSGELVWALPPTQAGSPVLLQADRVTRLRYRGLESQAGGAATGETEGLSQAAEQLGQRTSGVAPEQGAV